MEKNITKTTTQKDPVKENSELDKKARQADPMIKHAFTEYKKEISRLQKQLVKEQITHESEIVRLKAKFEKEQVTVVVSEFDKKL